MPLTFNFTFFIIEQIGYSLFSEGILDHNSEKLIQLFNVVNSRPSDLNIVHFKSLPYSVIVVSFIPRNLV
ncbi:hypothetical protein CHCC14557_3578 [Bacillus licheniformis]|nr:hypothetical protein CHCC14557_3578 [Bacillus licheniformis]